MSDDARGPLLNAQQLASSWEFPGSYCEDTHHVSGSERECVLRWAFGSRAALQREGKWFLCCYTDMEPRRHAQSVVVRGYHQNLNLVEWYIIRCFARDSLRLPSKAQGFFTSPPCTSPTLNPEAHQSPRVMQGPEIPTQHVRLYRMAKTAQECRAGCS